MKIRPLADRVLLEWVDTSTQTASGLFIPEAAKDKPTHAKVIAVGPGRVESGVLVEPRVKAGDVVLLSKYAGTEVQSDGKKLVMLREEEILAVVE